MKYSLALGVLVLCSASVRGEWLAWRGSFGNGVADGVAPQQCDDENIVWSTELPGRSVSSPIVVAGQVIVTASSGVDQGRLHIISVDANTGETRWHRQFWATGRTLSHPTSANAAPTPASDGEHIVASFSSNDVVCLNLDGELQWYRGLGSDYPKAGNDIGMASSPVVAGGAVVCQVENQGDSFVEGMDVVDGTTLWRLPRPNKANWTSPVRLPGTTESVLLKNGEGVSAYHIRTGDPLWQVPAEVGGIPTIGVTSSRIFVPGSTFVVLDRKSDAEVKVAWQSKTIKPDPTPIVTDDRFFIINSAGVLSANSAQDGERLWQVRVTGKYWASPIMAGDVIYTVNQKGALNIVHAERGKKLDTHQFDGEIMGTPAISDGALFVRGVSRLWKVAAN